MIWDDLQEYKGETRAKNSTLEMKQLYEQGLTFEEIGKRFNLTRQAVCVRLQGLISSRPKGGASKNSGRNAIARTLY